MQITMTKMITAALVGNPNTGKTTVFNALCGTRQRTGNYPGVTVEKRVGFLTLQEMSLEIYDLPGLYSLHVTSMDERIAFEVLSGKALEDNKKPDVVLYIIDASNLRRNLYLLLQVLELQIPVVGILTMMDVAQKKGYKIDVDLLQKKLSIPIIGINAKERKDIQKLKRELPKAIQSALEHPSIDIRKLYPTNFSQYFERSKNQIEEFFQSHGIPYSVSFADVSMSYYNSDEFLRYMKSSISNSLKEEKQNQFIKELQELITQIKQEAKNYHIFSNSQLVQTRYKVIDFLLKDVLQREVYEKQTLTEFLDSIFTHKIFGLLIFVIIMAIMFQSIYAWAEPLMGYIEEFFAFLSEKVSELGILPPMLESFINDGVIAGIGSVVVFIPQIAILFFFIAILEDTGYLARASFLMDKILSWTGLNGRSFIPLISSFACSIPGIMATRVISDDKVRTATILVSPLMPCSARLPVYVLFIGVFIEPYYGPLMAGLTLFIMYSIGPILAILVSLILSRGILKTPSIPFIMELPEYHFPSFRNVFFRVYDAVKAFLIRAGTIIFYVSVVIWALTYFPRDEEAAQKQVQPLVQELNQLKKQSEVNPDDEELQAKIAELEQEIENQIESFHLSNSYIGRLGKFVEPIFRPLGFDWKLSVGVLASFPAREVIIATLGIIYNVGGDADEESETLRFKLSDEKHPDGTPVYTPLTAISLMIFFALCAQCMSTLAIIKKELGAWKYSVFTFLYMTALAYLVSLVVYQIGSFLL
ncbi:MAG: ferrous iron transport protein B [Leptospiraceae bacterium]|nr:ferrous iron transport protein B [Leptospiraceae bacterium]MDW7975057.1 ferrous iron transport protein B [Leptospiraceae bacterium]